LYLETHRGTYTTQSAIKRANRKNELLLREAEIFGSLANLHGAGLDLKRLQPLWETLLLLQFHDILPGSSIGEVYREALSDHTRIETSARAVRTEAQQALAARLDRPTDAPGSGTTQGAAVIVFNSLSWPRSDVTTATIPDTDKPIELVPADGAASPAASTTAIPAQVVSRQGGQARIVFVPEAVPSLGYTTLRVRPATASAPATSATHSLRATERQIENRFFLIELGEDGTITRLLDKRNDREVIPAGERANHLQLFQDGPEPEAAWNIHATFAMREYDWDPGTRITVMEQGPVRAVVRITRRYRESRIEQGMIVYDRLPRIDFVTRADWQARQVMLKAAFPIEVLSPRATFEIQFGAVERPTHRNTSWDQEKFEVCAHRWADLSEPGYGVSLLNDSKYGYDVLGNTLRLTLLRGAEWPDPDADRGKHEFTYALLPHAGDWCAAETVRRAAELNTPMTCIALPTQAGAPGDRLPLSQSFFSVEGPALVETLKPAEDGSGWILRLYEPHGSRGQVHVRLPAMLHSATACNLIEDVTQPDTGEAMLKDGVLSFPIRPFEIKTFRLN
jgi:alpha-mannosidase